MHNSSKFDNQNHPTRFLIRASNWIGDAVMSVAALREIRRLFPEDHLTLLTRSWVAGLFEDQNLVDQIIRLETAPAGLTSFWTLRSKLHGFDRALLFQNAFRPALLTFLARVPDRIGYATDGRSLLLTRRASPRTKQLKRHQIFYYLDLLYQTGLSSQDYLNDPHFQPDIRLQASRKGIETSKALLKWADVDSTRHLIAMSPGAFFGSAKRWLPDRYAALADRLIGDQRAEILIVGNREESSLAREIENRMRYRPKILTGKTGLPTLMGLLTLCRLLITNDSGPMHLAAALDLPQIALFGSTDETATGPFSQQARIIHKHVECSPCLLRECPIDLRCFTQIEVDEVYAMALRILNCRAKSKS